MPPAMLDFRREDDPMFLRNCWYVAAEAGEVGRRPLGRMILGEPVALYRKEDGTAVALEDRCAHRRAPLHKGRLVGDALQCGYHGFVFAADGACIKVPGHERLPFRDVGVRSYRLQERHGYLWIWMGESAAADPALIPDFHQTVDPGWAATGALLPIAAHYLLLVENLLDLSHVAFVHSGTIGSDDSSAALEFDRGERFVRVVRAAKHIPSPPHMRRMGLGDHTDMTKVITFTPASSIVIDITWQGDTTMHVVIINSITPETAGSSHYFWANARDFDIGNAEMTDYFKREVIKAFNEDKDILEAQQRCIALDPEAPTVNVHADWGGVQARRLMDRLMADEAARPLVAAQ
jgi:phenylpropionate dioxygenase-like ring-hydroxylating dioxygenase large terminal subunit